jgi:hypothetical protein
MKRAVEMRKRCRRGDWYRSKGDGCYALNDQGGEMGIWLNVPSWKPWRSVAPGLDGTCNLEGVS